MEQEMSTQQGDMANTEDLVLVHYPWLLAYRRRKLFAIWQREREKILQIDLRLSEGVAGMLAQARLIVQIVDDTCNFEHSIIDDDQGEKPQELKEAEETLYLWLKEEWNLRHDLTILTGLSIWLPYEEMYRAHVGDERWWEDLFSSSRL